MSRWPPRCCASRWPAARNEVGFRPSRRLPCPAMLDEIAAARRDAVARAREVATVADARAIEPELTGRRSPLGQLKQRLGGLGPTQRKDAGQALNAAGAEGEGALSARGGGLAAGERRHPLETERPDLTQAPTRPNRRHLHPPTP